MYYSTAYYSAVCNGRVCHNESRPRAEQSRTDARLIPKVSAGVKEYLVVAMFTHPYAVRRTRDVRRLMHP